MRLRKHERDRKRQRGQYMTPAPLARKIVSGLTTDDGSRILEPSCGDGAFLSAIVDKLSDVSDQQSNGDGIDIVGIEIDPVLANKSRAIIEGRDSHRVNLRAEIRQADFFQEYLSELSTGQQGILGRESFDLIVGNPPFGGTFDQTIEDALDHRLGIRLGKKIKKETYSFFIVACIDLLRPGGRLVFVCSDTLLTIPTMTGLRHLLMERGEVEIHDIDSFSDETDYPMLVLDFTKRGRPGGVSRNSERIDDRAIRITPNLSWGITKDLSTLFSGGSLLRNFFVASSGMTTGKNELFVREIDGDGNIVEPYRFEFYDAPVTLEYELERARLGKLSERRIRALRAAQEAGETERRLSVDLLGKPLSVKMPDQRYRPYNKANSRLLFSHPTHCIYWENEGDAVLTYKRTGNWYLRGVGGQPYFGREGITWPLVANRFRARYIPPGYILDSGSPCAFVREGVDRDEIFFVLGWLLTDLANRVLKTAINHTRNIQSKDFERMPYPHWVSAAGRATVIKQIKAMIAEASAGRLWSWSDLRASGLNDHFRPPEGKVNASPSRSNRSARFRQLSLPAFE